MATLFIPRYFLDMEDDIKVCVYCDTDTTLPYCTSCNEYKGLMTIAEWESYTGEVWE